MGTYWTIQSIDKWVEIENKGYFTTDPHFIWPEFIEAYHWLMKKMNDHIPNYQNEYPIWLWTERPDLRRSGHLNSGEQGVLLKIDIADNRVLLSEFEAWHFVLNRWFFDLDDPEEESTPSQQELEQSWEMIFNFDLLTNHPNWGTCTLQGVTNHINLSEITLVREFTAR